MVSQKIDFSRHLPLLAFSRAARSSPMPRFISSWGAGNRHIGRISVLVHPDFRGRGLASAMVTEIVELSRQIGLEKDRGGIYRRTGGGDQDVRDSWL